MSEILEAGPTRILKAEGYRLDELIRAMFGKDIIIDLTITKVPHKHIEFIQGCQPDTHFKDYYAHIGMDGFVITLESDQLPLPF